MKLAKLKPRVGRFTSSRQLATLEKKHDEKRLRGRALMERNSRLMQQFPFCVDCPPENETPVDEWDHEVPLWKGGADNESNLRGRCLSHHRAKSERERIEREQKGISI